MKNIFKKLILALLTFALVFSVVACDDTSGVNPDGTTNATTGTFNNRIANTKALDELGYSFENTKRVEEVTESDSFLYQNGVCDYKMVYSNNEYSTGAEYYAAKEMQDLVKDATGVTIPIVNEDDVTNFTTSQKYISIGHTKMFNESGITLDYTILGNDGFVLKTIDNTLFINSTGNNGIIYGVYGFLERVINLHFYTLDEFTISKENTAKMKIFNVIDVPDFASRYIDNETNRNEDKYFTRLRMHGPMNKTIVGGKTEGGGWILSDTSVCSQLLKASEYSSTHPNWYYGAGGARTGQACISTILQNDLTYDEYGNPVDDLRPLDVMFESLVSYIKINPYHRVFFLGQNDNRNKCTCENCEKECAIIDYGGQYALLANALMIKLDEWQDNLPEGDFNKNRHIQLSFFAYQYTLAAPVKVDSATGEYKVNEYDAPYECLGGDGEKGDGNPYDVILDDRISVRIAPIEAQYTHTHYDDDYNNSPHNSFERWSVIAKSLAVWDYGTSFADYIVPFSDWNVIKDNYLYYHQKNALEYLTQLPHNTSGTGFNALAVYVRVELMWDLNQDAEELVKDFMLHYYGEDAYEDIYAYYNFMRYYYAAMDTKVYDENGAILEGMLNTEGVRFKYHGYIYETLTNQKYFPKVVVNRLMNFFESADQKIWRGNASEADKQKYSDRVNVESLFARYADLKLYFDFLSSEEKVRLINEFEHYCKVGGFTNTSQYDGSEISTFIALLRSKL